MNNEHLKHIDSSLTKKIKFSRETIRKLKVMVANEFFDKNLKNDDFISEMLEKIVNEYFEQYIDRLKSK